MRPCKPQTQVCLGHDALLEMIGNSFVVFLCPSFQSSQVLGVESDFPHNIMPTEIGTYSESVTSPDLQLPSLPETPESRSVHRGPSKWCASMAATVADLLCHAQKALDTNSNRERLHNMR